jgi:hypothetical protein
VKTVGIEKRRSKGVSSFISAIALIRCRVTSVKVLYESFRNRSNVLDVFIVFNE